MLGLIKYQHNSFHYKKTVNGKSREWKNYELKFSDKWINLPRSGNKNSWKDFFVTNKNRKNCSRNPVGVKMLKMKTHFLNVIWSAIDNFTYAPKNEITFVSYFRRYENLYHTDCANWADFKKKLGIFEHTKIANYILPKKTSNLTFTESVQLLTELFRPKMSPFHKSGNA